MSLHIVITGYTWCYYNTYRGLFVASIRVLLQKRNQHWSGLCGFFRLKGQNQTEDMLILFTHELHTLCSSMFKHTEYKWNCLCTSVQHILTGELSMNIKSKWFTVSWNKKNSRQWAHKTRVQHTFDVLEKTHLCLQYAWLTGLLNTNQIQSQTVSAEGFNALHSENWPLKCLHSQDQPSSPLKEGRQNQPRLLLSGE